MSPVGVHCLARASPWLRGNVEGLRPHGTERGRSRSNHLTRTFEPPGARARGSLFSRFETRGRSRQIVWESWEDPHTRRGRRIAVIWAGRDAWVGYEGYFGVRLSRDRAGHGRARRVAASRVPRLREFPNSRNPTGRSTECQLRAVANVCLVVRGTALRGEAASAPRSETPQRMGAILGGGSGRGWCRCLPRSESRSATPA